MQSIDLTAMMNGGIPVKCPPRPAPDPEETDEMIKQLQESFAAQKNCIDKFFDKCESRFRSRDSKILLKFAQQVYYSYLECKYPEDVEEAVDEAAKNLWNELDKEGVLK